MDTRGAFVRDLLSRRSFDAEERDGVFIARKTEGRRQHTLWVSFSDGGTLGEAIIVNARSEKRWGPFSRWRNKKFVIVSPTSSGDPQSLVRAEYEFDGGVMRYLNEGKSSR